MREQAAYLWLLGVSGALNGIGQLVMRWGGRSAKVPFSLANMGPWMVSSKWWLAGLLLTWTSGLFWALLLRSVRLVIALPIFAGVAWVLTVAGAVVLLQERPTLNQILGLVLVMTGIFLIAIKS